MQYLIYAFIGVLANALSSLVGRALLALGFSYFTYTGLNVGVDWIQNQMQGFLGAMPADILNFVGFLYIDKALSMVFSAFAAALVVRGASASITRMQIKK